MSPKIAKKAPVVEDELRDYELVLVFSPEVVEENDAAIGKVSQFITDKGGTVASVDRWGKMRLAYPIRHFAEGSYVLARFRLKPKIARELEGNLRISDEVLRHLLIKV
jgi:small subunit ribosomal protein S6